ncbi:plasma membrane protein Pth11-like protein [Hypoxylon sp. NC0597]|nr:plasma membrane protein Pth11-like protein [Hypoxylon sp. NC0597]
MSQHYYQRPGHVIAAGVGLPVADIVVVGLRFWLRKRQKLPLKPDDWLMVPATLMTLGVGICLVYGVSQEALAYPTKVPAESADHAFEIATDQIALASKIEYAFTLLYVLALGPIKASFLFFYLRIFSTGKGRVRFVLIGLVILVALWTIAWLFESIFDCNLNFWAIWGAVDDMRTECVNTLGADLALCITDFIMDVFIIIVPIPLIWRLKLSTGRKIATSCIFLLGAVSIAASLTRLIVTAQVIAVGFAPGADDILVITLYLYWGMVECGVGVLAACIPTLTSLFRGLTWESVIATTRSFLGSDSSRASFTNLGSASVPEHTLVAHQYDKYTTSTRSSSTRHLPIVTDNEYIPNPESYPMHDVVRARESV